MNGHIAFLVSITSFTPASPLGDLSHVLNDYGVQDR